MCLGVDHKVVIPFFTVGVKFLQFSGAGWEPIEAKAEILFRKWLINQGNEKMEKENKKWSRYTPLVEGLTSTHPTRVEGSELS